MTNNGFSGHSKRFVVLRNLLPTLVDVEETSFPPILPVEEYGTLLVICQNMQVTMSMAAVGKAFSIRTERLHLIQRNFDKKGKHLFFFHIEIILGIFIAWECSETFSLHISKAPSLNSFIFVQHSGGMLCPLSLTMEFDTFPFGF